MYGKGNKRHTCPKEENFVPPVGGIHQIHSDGGEVVVDASAHHQRALVERVDGVVHEGMRTDKVHRLIRELFRRAKARREGSPRALKVKCGRLHN